jgi:hypothetical protein
MRASDPNALISMQSQSVFGTKSEPLAHWRLVKSNPTQIEAMSYLQDCIDQLNPVAALPSIAVLFLIASILGWYVGSLIQWLWR